MSLIDDLANQIHPATPGAPRDPIADLEDLAAKTKAKMDALPSDSPLRAHYFKLLSLMGTIQADVASSHPVPSEGGGE